MRLFLISLILLAIMAGQCIFPVTGEIRVITPESRTITPESRIITESTISPGLHAGFTAAPTSGRVPLMVQFFDLSNGYPVKWYWDFGDREASEEPEPIHTYVGGGKFTVKLTVYDQGGGSSTAIKDQYITALPLPLSADFSADPMSGTAPLTVRFTDRSVGAMYWLWNFGDGSPDRMIPNPSNTYMIAGTYRVVLKVSNELGESATHKQDIHVTSADQVKAGFTGTPTFGPVPLSVRFTDNSTGNVVSWRWKFGDGSVNTTQNPVHTYLISGVYPVALTVKSADGTSDTEQKEEYINATGSQVSGSIILYPGWNLVSVPGVLTKGKDTAEIFQHVDAAGHHLLMYNPVTGGWNSLARDSPVRPLEAFWIYSSKNNLVPVSFDPNGQVSPHTLVKGWNTVGFTGFNPAEAKQALLSVKDAWKSCIGFNATWQRYDEGIHKGINDNLLVHPYQGYWVYMSGEGRLTGSLP
jgi:PKD repeat protein